MKLVDGSVETMCNLGDIPSRKRITVAVQMLLRVKMVCSTRLVRFIGWCRSIPASQRGVNTVVVSKTVMDCKVVNVFAVNELKLWA